MDSIIWHHTKLCCRTAWRKSQLKLKSITWVLLGLTYIYEHILKILASFGLPIKKKNEINNIIIII